MINDFSQGSNLCNLSIRWQIHQSDFVVLFAVCDMHPRNVKIISPQSESPLKSSFNDSMYKAPLKYRRCYSIRLYPTKLYCFRCVTWAISISSGLLVNSHLECSVISVSSLKVTLSPVSAFLSHTTFIKVMFTSNLL